MADEYSRALFYDYQARCEPVDDDSGSFCRNVDVCLGRPWACPCGNSDACVYRGPVLGTEIGLAIQDCEGVQIGVTL